MKKITVLSLLFICLVATLPATAQNDAKAKTVLENLSKKLKSLKSVKANFALHLSGTNGKVKDSKKGSFSLKGEKYHVVLNGQEIICDNKTVWTYTADAKEVQVSNYNPSEQTLTPAKLFTNFYDKEYKYTYKGEQKMDGKSCDVVTLVPLKVKQFTKIELIIDKATSIIVGGNIWEKNGNEYAYDVSGFTPNPNIPDTYFTFDTKAHPGVEVVDLR